MEWSDEALVIGTKKHGENGVIVEAMTFGHGRHLGLVRGGRSRRYAAILQAGNSVGLVWRARLEEHLGAYTVAAQKLRAAELMRSRERLSLSQLICMHLRNLAEREPHSGLFSAAIALHECTADGYSLGTALAQFEMRLLSELGYGIDNVTCALTGAREGLCYVSPKSGKAVSAEAATPYLKKLLPLPALFGGGLDLTPEQELRAAFDLTGHFLNMHVWQTRQVSPPTMRQRLIQNLCDRL